MEALKAFRVHSLNPEHPATRGTTVNPDIFFQCREACNQKFAAIPEAVEHYMAEIGKLTGRTHHLFDYYGAPDAERVVILMGSAAETARETVDYLTARGEKVGLINVHLYRPFSAEHLLSAIPQTCRKIAVLDRTKDPAPWASPCTRMCAPCIRAAVSPWTIVGAGTASAPRTPPRARSWRCTKIWTQASPKRDFTIGIVDDVTHTSLPVTEIETSPAGQTSGKFWGMGLRRHGGRQQELHQDHRPRHRPVLPGLFCVRLQEVRRSDPEPPTVRENAHPISLSDHQGGLCCLPQPLLRPQVRHGEQSEGGRHLPAELPLGRGGAGAASARLYEAGLWRPSTPGSTPSTPSTLPGSWGWGTGPTPFSRRPSSPLSKVIPIEQAVAEMKDAIYKRYYKKKGQAVVDAMNYASIDHGINGPTQVEIPERLAGRPRMSPRPTRHPPLSRTWWR